MGRTEMFKSRIRRLEERVEALEKVPIQQPVSVEVTGVSVGENIKARRSALGIDQEELAQAVGISRSMMCQIERGSKVPNVILARDISRVLQCDLNDLVGG